MKTTCLSAGCVPVLGDLDDAVVIGFQGLGENVLGFRDFLDLAETLEKLCWFFWDCFSVCR